MRRAEEFVIQAVDLGLIEIDEKGRIWRIARQQTSRWRHPTKIVPCRRSRADTRIDVGYRKVPLMLDGRREIAAAHRLVWLFFNGGIPGELTINHKDGDKLNNHPHNLELATRSEQSLHAVHVLGYRPERHIKRKIFKGESNPTAKLKSIDVRKIRKSKDSTIRLADRFGVSCSTIKRVRNLELWRHV